MATRALRFVLGALALGGALALTMCSSGDMTTSTTGGPCPDGICGPATGTGASTGVSSSTGMMAGSGGMTSTSSSVGSGGMCPGGAMKCGMPSDCPDPGTECKTRTCDAGCCGTTNAADLTATTTGQTAKDCQQQVCDGMGGVKAVADDTDKPDDQDACHSGACTGGVPGQTLKPADTACAFGGGKFCTAAGACVECNSTAQCNVGTQICQANSCVSASCADMILDGSETDKDCGGPVCNGCATGKKCLVGTDCLDLVCNAGAKTCDMPTCADGQKNGNETATDCGGATCDAAGKTCAVGQGCAVAADCASGFCQGNVCTLKPLGTTCGMGAECVAPGACVDGVCCDSTCTGTCRACTTALKGAGANGNCGNIILGNDPGNECTAANPTSCGFTGVCDGAGACQDFSNATVCAPQTCAGSTLTAQSMCSGTGTCVAGATSNCASGCNAGGTACNVVACTEKWVCTPWDTGTGMVGSSNAATRTCVDQNNCPAMLNKPVTTATLPALDVNYFECNVEPILDKKCGMLGCHGVEGQRALRVYAKARLRALGATLTNAANCAGSSPSASCIGSNSCPCDAKHTGVEWQRNYDAARGFAIDAMGNLLPQEDQSDLIQQPIVGGKSHAGIHLFQSADPEHATILNWLNGATLPNNTCIGLN
jgi:hypothetical protein